MPANISLSLEELENYASVLGLSVIQEVEEVAYAIHHKMVNWCMAHDGIVVLENGDILTSAPTSADVHECQRHLGHHGMVCGKIYPTTDVVINALKTQAEQKLQTKDDKAISDSHHQLRAVIYSALKSGASDIHITIMPAVEQTEVRFRIDGMLKLYARWTDQVGIKVHSVAYNYLSTNKQDAFSMILPQDMSFTEQFDDYGTVRIRSSNIGIKNGGCKIVYRLLSVGSEEKRDIKSLGYTPSQVALLEEVRNLGSGMVLFCGETGSGKTTSLASVLSGIDIRKSAYSIEDPVEQYIDNVDQCPIDTRIEKRNFAYYLRALLRADPDVIMVDEIRDSDTAKIAIQGSLTGHLILSTLHTRHAVNAAMRLNELGVPPKNLATPGLLKFLIAQQLYPILCQECARPLNEEEKEKIFGAYEKDSLHLLKTSSLAKTCKTCHGEGTTGRKVYAEIIKVDRKSREFIANIDISGWEKYLKEQGFLFLDEQVHNDILAGKIDALALKALEPPEVESYRYTE